jgi:arylsulfatase A-like enzyme
LVKSESAASSRSIVLLVAMLAGTAACAPPADDVPWPREPVRNVVVVVVDALRADHLGCYGYPGETTPSIDLLADNALVFANAYSNATYTFPSTASMFTATLPVVHRIDWNEKRQERIRRLSDEYLLLTEVFHEAGFRTGLLTFPGWVSPTANYMQGVDVRIESERNDRDLLKRAFDFISASAGVRFFLYLHFIDMHDYYHPGNLFAGVDPASSGLSEGLLELRGMTNRQAYMTLARELRGKLSERDLEHLISVYDERLRDTDRLIGELARHLHDLGLRDDTLLVITSDHGEQFQEHGRLVHGGDAFYNEVLRIPFIVNNPRLFPSTTRATTPISSIDFGPTVLDLAGLDVPAVFQGEPIAGRPDEDRPVFATDGRTWKETTRGWSFIVSLEKQREELYRLTDDPGETINLVGEETAAVRQMREHVEQMVRACNAHPYRSIEIDEVDLPDEQRERLRALGYVD